MAWRGRTTAIAPIPAGTVLRLTGTDWRYGKDMPPGRPATLVVHRLRHELSVYYDGEWIWVDAHTLDCDRKHEPCRQALISTQALARNLTDGPSEPPA